MKRFFSIAAVVMLLVVLVMGSCEKKEMQEDEKIEGLDKNKLELVSENYESDGVTGELYLYGGVQKVFVSHEKKLVNWEHTVYSDGNSCTCNGPAKDCKIYTEGDGVCIRVRPDEL